MKQISKQEKGKQNFAFKLKKMKLKKWDFLRQINRRLHNMTIMCYFSFHLYDLIEFQFEFDNY